MHIRYTRRIKMMKKIWALVLAVTAGFPELQGYQKGNK